MRGVIWGLLVSNLLLFGWHFLQRGAVESVGLVREPRSSVPALVLLSEVPDGQLQAFTFASRADDAGPAAEPYCVEVGPFASELILEQFVAARAGGRQMRPDKRSVSGDVQYRVYMPVQESREAASTLLATLRAAIIEHRLGYDSFVISSGEMENAISLGLFSEQANARDVEAQLAALGYEVQIREETKPREEMWLLSSDFVSSEQFNLWWLEIAPTSAGLQRREKLCETIAQPF